MARRRRAEATNRIEALFKASLALACFIAFAIGGARGFVPVLAWVVKWLIVLTLAAGGISLMLYALTRHYRADDSESDARDSASPDSPTEVPRRREWTFDSIRTALEEIDWYQFEKFCAALLAADGLSVTRRGGAHPDGGVDLVATMHDGTKILVQCKHWRRWQIKEPTVRELIGSMTVERIDRAAIHTLKGWTNPAATLAAQNNIALADGNELARWALEKLTPDQLDTLLDATERHCPKCEAPMVWRTGDFEPFWGCSRYPACRGKLNQ